MDYWGGAKGMLAPLLKLLGGGGPAPPPSSYAYEGVDTSPRLSRLIFGASKSVRSGVWVYTERNN